MNRHTGKKVTYKNKNNRTKIWVFVSINTTENEHLWEKRHFDKQHKHNTKKTNHIKIRLKNLAGSVWSHRIHIFHQRYVTARVVCHAQRQPVPFFDTCWSLQFLIDVDCNRYLILGGNNALPCDDNYSRVLMVLSNFLEVFLNSRRRHFSPSSSDASLLVWWRSRFIL